MAWTQGDQNLKNAGLAREVAEALRDDPQTLATLPAELRELIVSYNFLNRDGLLESYIELVDFDHPNG